MAEELYTTGLTLQLEGFNKFIENLATINTSAQTATTGVNALAAALNELGSAKIDSIAGALSSVRYSVKSLEGMSDNAVLKNTKEVARVLTTFSSIPVNTEGLEKLTKALYRVASGVEKFITLDITAIAKSLRDISVIDGSKLSALGTAVATLTTKLTAAVAVADKATAAFASLTNVNLTTITTALTSLSYSLGTLQNIRVNDVLANLRTLLSALPEFAKIKISDFGLSKLADALSSMQWALSKLGDTDIGAIVTSLQALSNIDATNITAFAAALPQLLNALKNSTADAAAWADTTVSIAGISEFADALKAFDNVDVDKINTLMTALESLRAVVARFRQRDIDKMIAYFSVASASVNTINNMHVSVEPINNLRLLAETIITVAERLNSSELESVDAKIKDFRDALARLSTKGFAEGVTNLAELPNKLSKLAGLGAILDSIVPSLSRLPDAAAKLVEFTKALHAFGNKSITDAITSITDLGNNITKLFDFATAIERITGALTISDKNVASFSALIDVLRRFGSPTAEAGIARLKDLPKIIDGIDKAFIQISNISNLSTVLPTVNKLTIAMSELAESMLKFGKSAMTEAIRNINRLSDNTVGIAKLTNILTTLADFSKKIDITALGAISTAIKNMASAISAFGRGSIEKSFDNIVELPIIVAKLTTALGSLSSIGAANLTGITNSIAAIAGLTTALSRIGSSKGITNLPAAMDAMVASISRLIAAALRIDTISGSLANISGFAKALTELVDAFKRLAASTTITDRLADNVDLLVAAIVKLGAQAPTMVAAFRDMIPVADVIRNLAEAARILSLVSMQKQLQAMTQQVKDASSGMTRFRNILNGFANAGRLYFLPLTLSVKGLIIVLEQLKNVFVRVVGAIGSMAWTVLLNTLKALGNAIRTVVVTAFTTLANVLLGILRQAINTTISIIKTLTGAIISATINGVQFLIRSAIQLAQTLVAITAKSVWILIQAFDRLFVAMLKLPFRIIIAGFKAVVFIGKALLAVVNTLIHAFNLLVNALTLFQASRIVNMLKGIGSGSKTATDGIVSTTESFTDLNTTSTATTKNLDKYEQELTQVNRQAGVVVKTNTGLATSFTGVNTALSVLNSAGLIAIGHAATSVAKKVAGTYLAVKTLTIAGQAMSRIFQSSRFVIERFGREALNAITSLESLTLSITQLQRVELVNSGAFSDMNAALTTAQSNAAGLVEEFKQLAIASPFGLEDVAEMFRLGLAYGFTTDNARSLTYILTDTASALNLTSSDALEVARAFGQMSSLGKITAQDLNQLAQRGIGVREIFKDYFNTLLQTDQADEVRAAIASIGETIGEEGVTAGQALEIIQKGFMSADEAIVVIAKDLQSKFGGAAKDSGNTIKGLLASLSDLKAFSLAEVVGPIIRGLLPMINDSIAILQTPAVTESLRNFGTMLANVIVPAVTNLRNLLYMLVSGFAGLPDGVKKAVSVLGKFVATALAITAASAIVMASLTLLGTAMTLLINPVTLVAIAIVGAIQILRNYGKEISAFITGVSGVLYNFIANLLNIKSFTTVTDAVNGAIGSMVTGISNGIKYLANFGASITKMAQDGVTSLSSLAGEGLTVIDKFVNGMALRLSEVVNYGAGLVEAFASGIISAVGLVGKAIKAIADTVAYWLAPGSPPRALPNIDTWGQAAAQEFIDAFSTADFDVIKSFTSTVEGLLTSLGIDSSNLDFGILATQLAEITMAIREGDDPSAFINALSTSIPGATAEMSSLVAEYTALIAANQEAIDASTAYESALNSLQGQIDDIDLGGLAQQDQDRIDQLQANINAGLLNPTQVAAANKAIERLQAEQQLRELERQKEIADAKALASKEVVDRTLSEIEIAKQYAKTLNGTGADANGLDSLSDKLPKISTDGVLDGSGLTESLEDMSSGVSETLNSLFTGLGEGIKPLQSSFDSLQAKLDETKLKITTTFVSIKDSIVRTLDKIVKPFRDAGITIDVFKRALIGLGAAVVVGALATLLLAITPLSIATTLLAAAIASLVTGWAIATKRIDPTAISSAFRIATDAFNRFVTAYSAADKDIKGFDFDFSSLSATVTSLGNALGLVVATADTFGANVIKGIQNAIATDINTFDWASLDFSSVEAASESLALSLGKVIQTAYDFGNGIVAGLTASEATIAAFNFSKIDFTSANSIGSGLGLSLRYIVRKAEAFGTGVVNGLTASDTAIAAFRFSDFDTSSASNFGINLGKSLKYITANISDFRTGVLNGLAASDTEISSFQFSKMDMSSAIASGESIAKAGRYIIAQVDVFTNNLRTAFGNAQSVLDSGRLTIDFSSLDATANTIGTLAGGLATDPGTTIELFKATLSPETQNAIGILTRFIDELSKNLVETGIVYSLGTLAENIGKLALKLAAVVAAVAAPILLALPGIIDGIAESLNNILTPLNTLTDPNKTPNERLTALGEVLKGLAASPFDIIAKGLDAVKEGVLGIIESFTGSENSVETINAVTNAFNALGLVLTALLAAKSWVLLAAGFTTITTTLAGGGGLTAVLGGLRIALAALGGPVGIILGLAAALYYAWKNNLWGFQDAVNATLPVIQEKWDTFVRLFQIGWAAMKTGLKLFVDKAIQAWDDFKLGLSLFTKDAKRLLDGVTTVMGNVWESFINADATQSVLDSFKAFWDSVVSLFDSEADIDSDGIADSFFTRLVSVIDTGMALALSTVSAGIDGLGALFGVDMINIFNPLKALLTGEDGIIATIGDTAQAFVDWVKDPSLAGFIDIFKPILDFFAGTGSDGTSGLAGAIHSVIDEINGFLKSIGISFEIPQAYDLLLTAITNIGDTAKSAIDWVQSFVDKLKTIEVPNPFESLRDILGDIGDKFSKLGALLGFETETTLDIDVSPVPTINPTAAANAATTFSIYGTGLGANASAGIIDGYATAMSSSESTKKTEAANQTWLDKFAGWFGIESPSTVMRDEIGTPLGEGIIVGLVDYMASIDAAALFQDLLDSIVLIWTDLGLAVVDTIVVTMENVGLAVLPNGNTVKASVEELVAAMRLAFTTIIAAFTNIATTAMNAIVVTTINNTAAVVNAVQSVLSAVSLLGQGEESPAFLVGSQLASAMFRGLEKGIKDKIDDITAQIRAAINAAFTAGMTELDAHSPSRRAALELGAPLVDGIIVGIEDRTTALNTAIEGVLATPFNNEMRPIEDALVTTGLNFGLSIADGITMAIPNIVAAINSVSSAIASPFSIKARANELNSNSSLFTNSVNSIANMGNNIMSAIPAVASNTMPMVTPIGASSNSITRTTTNNVSYTINMQVTPEQAVQVHRNFQVAQFIGL
jgi:hypothetical protein